MAKGLFRDSQRHHLFKMQSPKYQHVVPTMPGIFDLRRKVAPPENQMQCGGCWAFSITNSLRSLKMLAVVDPGSLSKNYLLLNVGPVPENGCNGGDFDAGQNMLSGNGPCLESVSPFTGSDSGVSYPSNAGVAATAKRWIVVGDGYDKPTAQQLCEALWNQGNGACLSVDVAADSTIENYASGVIRKTTSLQVNHMIRCVGYNAVDSIDANGNAAFNEDGSWAEPNSPYFIFRNNWDIDWGIDGDGYIAYGVNNFAETAMLFE
jgi:C1A family cysteine protease